MTQLLHGDCLELLKTLPDNSVDSIVTDPPYELGFMGKKWDNTGIAYNVEMWAECMRVLKHGGHLLAFGGTRTYHRMACAIEDAGFEVRDMIEWVYGSGFPKSLNIGKAVDAFQQGTNQKRQPDREIIGVAGKSGKDRNVMNYYKGGEYHATAPATEQSKQWEGWGTALKPAHEPICMARKPLSEKTVAENCLKWGTGGINVDGSRVGTTDTYHYDRKGGSPIHNGGENVEVSATNHEQGRFPANLIHDNSEEVRECFPDTKSPCPYIQQTKSIGNIAFSSEKYHDRLSTHHGDSGNASRFFKSIIYNPKASKSDRGKGNTHATVKPTALMEYLIKMVTRQGGTVLDPFMGSGTTGVAATRNGYGFIGMEKEADHFAICKARIENDVEQEEQRGDLDLPHKQLTLF